jgi:hypothetical protein
MQLAFPRNWPTSPVNLVERMTRDDTDFTVSLGTKARRELKGLLNWGIGKGGRRLIWGRHEFHELARDLESNQSGLAERDANDENQLSARAHPI